MFQKKLWSRTRTFIQHEWTRVHKIRTLPITISIISISVLPDLAIYRHLGEFCQLLATVFWRWRFFI